MWNGTGGYISREKAELEARTAFLDDTFTLMVFLDGLESEDVGPRDKGRWIWQFRDSENDEWKCSRCGSSSAYKYPFCPWCGAKEE